MATINRENFFKRYRAEYGPLTQELVGALNDLLGAIEAGNDFDLSNPVERRQLAYCLATFKWETAHTFRPIHEHGSDDYFNTRYGPQTSVGRKLGNTKAGDGARFHGRGYVQLTGRSNYVRAGEKTGEDLVNMPNLALAPSTAYEIAIAGMKEGWFTGKKLSNFISAKGTDYASARTIINGHDKADLIAGIARRMDDVLRDSIEG